MITPLGHNINTLNVDPKAQSSKHLKKEIQRLVTMLMQKEGKLKEDQEFNEGQFVIKVNNKKRKDKTEQNQCMNSLQSQGDLVKIHNTNGSLHDRKIVETCIDDDEVGMEEGLQNVTEYLGDVNNSTMGEANTFSKLEECMSPKFMANHYPTLSPRGIFARFN